MLKMPAFSLRPKPQKPTIEPSAANPSSKSGPTSRVVMLSIAYCFDPKSKQYAMLNITTRDVGPDLLEGFAADGSIVGFCGFGRNEKAGIFSMAPDGSNYVRLENGQFGKPLRLYNQIVAGKDGTLFATALTSIVKFKSLKDEPVLVHKFVNAPTDGNDPDANVVLDSKGNLYGTTARGGMSQHGVIYKVDADGSNYQVVYN